MPVRLITKQSCKYYYRYKHFSGGSMKLTTKMKRVQKTIADALKKGLPLAGLLSSLVVTTSCDLFKKSSDAGPTAGYISEPKPAQVATQEQATPDQPEESAIRPPADKQPDSPVVQKSNVSEAQSLGAQITTGDPQLPIVPDINNEALQHFNNLIEKNIRVYKINNINQNNK